MLTADASGTGSWQPAGGGGGYWTLNGSDIYYDAGNVGIGTASPVTALQIDGSHVLNRGLIYLNSTDNAYIGLNSAVGSASGIFLRENDSTKWSIDYISSSDYLRFYNSTLSSVAMVIDDATGNVGVGTTSPGYKLDVSGDINFTGSIYQNGSPFGDSSLWTDQGTYISANNAPNVVVEDIGYVGIGVSNPGHNLHVANTSSSSSIGIENAVRRWA